MNTKLTLTIEEDIIKKAKDYAKQKNRSLSDIIENYLKAITSDNKDDISEKLTPIVKSLRGSFKMKFDMDYKEELGKSLEKKYL